MTKDKNKQAISTPSSRDQIHQESNRHNEISPTKGPRERSIVRNRGVGSIKAQYFIIRLKVMVMRVSLKFLVSTLSSFSCLKEIKTTLKCYF